MEAIMEQRGEVLIVHLKGRVDYDSADPFRETCLNHLIHHKVIFDLQDLSFVGSSGITCFIKTISELSYKNPEGIKFSRVSSEFLRIFEASDIRNFEVFENDKIASMSFYEPESLSVPEC